MKNLYRIIGKNGETLCFQVAKSEKEALEAARLYGKKGKFAELVR